jgi:glycosyltransferase involved in cell wall biosynthesis
MGVGGLERNLALIVENLDHQRFDVSVWCLEEGGAIADELREKGVDVRILDLPTYHRPGNVVKLARLLRRENVEILHTHEYFANTMGRLAAVLAGTPRRFAHIQNSHWTRAKRRARHYLIDRILSHTCDRVIACSEMARRYQIEVKRIHPDRVVIVPNCTDAWRYDPSVARPGIRGEFGFTDAEILIASVARLTEIKGHQFLIDAAVRIFDAIPACRILIVGDGPERSYLERQARALALEDRIHFLGTRQDMPNILASIDLLVQPTLVREKLPLAITEAMASGKPVVATDVGGVSEAVRHGETGILVPPGDADALAEGILSLLRDPEHRAAMAAAGRRLCLDQFSIETVIKTIESLYAGHTAGCGAGG